MDFDVMYKLPVRLWQGVLFSAKNDTKKNGKSHSLRLIQKRNYDTIKGIKSREIDVVGDNMVREKNVKLMTKIAIYEKNEGKKEIPMTEYFKGDYVRLNSLKSVIGGTIAFALVVMLAVLYKAEYFLANIMKVDYKQIGVKVILVYFVWIVLYWLIARIYYARTYEKARKHIISYNQQLKKLQEEAKKDEVKTVIPKGGVVIGDDFMDF